MLGDGFQRTVLHWLMIGFASGATISNPVSAGSDATALCEATVPVDVLERLGRPELPLALDSPFSSLLEEALRQLGEVESLHVELRYNVRHEGSAPLTYDAAILALTACPPIDTVPSSVPPSHAPDERASQQSEGDGRGSEELNPDQVAGLVEAIDEVTTSPRPTPRPEIELANGTVEAENPPTSEPIANAVLFDHQPQVAEFLASADAADSYLVEPHPGSRGVGLGPYVVTSKRAIVASAHLTRFRSLVLETPGAFLSGDLQKSCPSSPELVISLFKKNGQGAIDAIVSTSCAAIGFIEDKQSEKPLKVYYYDPVIDEMQDLLEIIAEPLL